MGRPRKSPFAPSDPIPDEEIEIDVSESVQETAQKNPLIITMSQLLAMSPDEREEFRRKDGTVTEDPPTQ